MWSLTFKDGNKIIFLIRRDSTHPIVPLCVSHKLVALVELFFAVVALKLKCVLVDPLVNSSHLVVKESLFTSFTFVRSLPCVADCVTPQGSLRTTLLTTRGAELF